MNENYDKNYKALAVAIVEQAAKDMAEGFFLREDSPIHTYLPELDAPKMWKQIKQNQIEYGTYRKLEDGEIESKWRSYKKAKFDEQNNLKHPWFIFYEGEPRWIIEEWFDEHYSKGIGALRKLSSRKEKVA